jgi:hypothetical protein
MINLSRSYLMVLLVVAFIVVTLLGFSIGMAVTQSQAIAREDLSTQVSNAKETVTCQAATGTAAAATIEALTTRVSNAEKIVTSQAAMGTAAAATIEALTTEVSNAKETVTSQAATGAAAAATIEALTTEVSNLRLAAQSAFLLNDTISVAPEKYASIPGIELNGSFTIAAWVKREFKDKDFFAIGQGKAERNKGLVFGYAYTNKFKCAFWDNDWTTPSTYTNTGWIHWACTVDANQECGEDPCRIIYKDGKVEVGQHTGGSDGEYQGSGPLLIGNAPRQTQTEGSIAGVAVYTRVLNEGEIRSLMERTRPAEVTPTPTN